MTAFRTRIRVDPDHRISGIAPPNAPPGEHEVTLISAPPPMRVKASRRFDVDALPAIELGPWSEYASLRREDFYGDDGR
jgi:hypothetical protein